MYLIYHTRTVHLLRLSPFFYSQQTLATLALFRDDQLLWTSARVHGIGRVYVCLFVVLAFASVTLLKFGSTERVEVQEVLNISKNLIKSLNTDIIKRQHQRVWWITQCVYMLACVKTISLTTSLSPATVGGTQAKTDHIFISAKTNRKSRIISTFRPFN